MDIWVLGVKGLKMDKCMFINKSVGVLGFWDLGRSEIHVLHPCTGLAPTSVCVLGGVDRLPPLVTWPRALKSCF